MLKLIIICVLLFIMFIGSRISRKQARLIRRHRLTVLSRLKHYK